MALDREEKKKMADLLISYLNHVNYVPDDDEAMDSLTEQLEIKHSYNDMEERYWFYDGEERDWFYDGE